MDECGMSPYRLMVGNVCSPAGDIILGSCGTFRRLSLAGRHRSLGIANVSLFSAF